MRTLRVVALGLTLATTMGTALADDWIVTRLRGGVFVLTDGQWEQLQRGSVVSDDRVIKSAPNSRATLSRNAEAVELGPDTTIQIADMDGFTTVYNHLGTVGVNVEARNVQHFAVQTHHLAAVVKGTAFVVQSGSTQSTVAVTRGTVEVNDSSHGSTINLERGQEVTTSDRPITAADVVPISPGTPRPPEAGTPPPSAPAAAGVVPATAGGASAAGAPGQSAGSAGNSGNAPGHGGGSPGNSGNAPGHGGGSPGNSGNAPGHGGGSPGNSGNAPGHGGGSPGNSGNAPGHGGGSPGNSGNAPGHNHGSSGDNGGGPGPGGGPNGGGPGRGGN